MGFGLTVQDEDAVYAYEEKRKERDKGYTQSASTTLASRAAAIHRTYPHLTPGVALALAKGNANEATIEQAAKRAAEQAVAEQQRKAAEPKGLGDKIYEKFKTGTRYAAAALAFPYEVGVNLASQAFSGGDPGVREGLVISTSLGSLIRNDELAGSGFFMGGEALQKQGERARRYRGTINGQAWTIGRGAASLVSEPGSDAYRYLSGLVDAAAIIGLDPVNFLVPVGGELGAAKKGVTRFGRTGRILPVAADDLARLAGSEITTNAVEAAGGLFKTSKQVVAETGKSWLDSATGQRVVQQAAGINNLWEMRQAFPRVGTRMQVQLLDAKTPEEVRAVLAPALGLEAGVSKVSDFKYRHVYSKLPKVEQRSRVPALLRNLFEGMPNRQISLRPGDRNIDEAMYEMDAWLASNRYTPEERAPVLEKFARNLINEMDPEEAAIRAQTMREAAEATIDLERRPKAQQLEQLQQEADSISRQAIADGYAETYVRNVEKPSFRSGADLRNWLREPNQLGQLRNAFDTAVGWMERAGIGLDRQTLRPTSSLRVGVRNAKGRFDRFGNRLGGELDDLVNALGGRVQEYSRRGWVKYGESARDRGMGFYRGGTKQFLQGVDQALNNMTFGSGAEMSIAEFAEEFVRNADIIDTLRPLFAKGSTQAKGTRLAGLRTYGDAGDLLDPTNLFGREYSGLKYEDIVEATRNREALAKVNTAITNNTIDEIVEKALAGQIDELAGFSEQEIFDIIGRAIARTPSQALADARRLETVITTTQKELDEIDMRLERVGLAPVGSGRAGVYQIAEQFRELMIEGLVRNGIDREFVNTLFDAYYANIKGQSLYAIDEMGNPTDFGLLQALIPNDAGDLRPVDAVLGSPGLRSEMLQRTIFMPDPRQIRRLQSELGWITGTKRGDMRMPLSALEGFQQDIWRPMVLMTGGYVIRNVAEAQARLTLMAPTSMFKHPLLHIMWASGFKGAGDAMGKAFEIIAPFQKLVRKPNREQVEQIDDAVKTLMRGSQEEYVKAIGASYHRYGGDPITARQSAIRSGLRPSVTKTDRPNYIRGIADELRFLTNDPVALMAAQGNDETQIIRWLTQTDEGRQRWSELYTEFENGIVSIEGGKQVMRSISLAEVDSLREYVRTYVLGRLDHNAGATGALKNDVLRDVVAFRAVQTGDEIPVTAEELKQFKRVFKSQTEGPNGNVYLLRQEVRKVKGKKQTVSIFGRYVDDGTQLQGGRLLVMEDAYDDLGEATPALTDALKRILDDSEANAVLPNITKYEPLISPERLLKGRGSGELAKTVERMKRVTDYFFGKLYGYTTAYLDRSPLYRQVYYKRVGELFDLMDDASVVTFRDNILKGAADLKLDPDDYVGSTKLWKRIEERAAKPTGGGRINLTQMDSYAKGFALDELNITLYSAVSRNNFTDIARIIAPFGQAWGEVLNTWVRLIATDPKVLRRASLIVETGKEADPDGDGRGFFYKDPVTGEYVFNYPLSDKGIGLLTGPIAKALDKVPILNRFGSDAGPVNASLTAPIKSLNMALTLTPGIGPMLQVPAAIILRNVPGMDQVKEVLMPYGDPSLRGTTFIPAWLQKFASGVWDGPDTSRLMGQTYAEVVQSLHASGNYNTSDQNDRERMFEDAIGISRQLTVLRSFGQFIGPTRPVVEFSDGDIMTAFYAQILEQFRLEDYDTATSRFMELFPNAISYLGAKTKAQYGGLDAGNVYGKWEEENGAVIKRYRDVGGYFGPTGGDFDIVTYSRQLAQGKRSRMTARQIIEQAEFQAGNAMYKEVAKQFQGPRTDEVREQLRQYRELLGQKYPGFATLQSFDTQKFDREVAQLRRATTDNELEGNPVRDAVEIYLTARDEALGVAQSRGRSSLGGRDDDDLRQLLRQLGETLGERYPDFVRLYDRVLSREVESDTDPNG